VAGSTGFLKHALSDLRKQGKATNLLREGLAGGEARIAHQAVVEFIAETTRPLGSHDGEVLLGIEEASQEAEEIMAQFPILYPSGPLLHLAIQGWSTYRFGWFNAHMWAYAEYFGLATLYSEDYQHGRLYGGVRVVNPIAE
jgi:predicted nucleic acid-binding protein